MTTGLRPVTDARGRLFATTEVQAAWKVLDCGFAAVADVFEDCYRDAASHFTAHQIQAYLAAASVIGKLGRGAEPLLAFLQQWPVIITAASGDPEPLLPQVMGAIRTMQKSPNSKAIIPFLQTLAPVARRLQSAEQIELYIDIALNLMARTSGSIHGHHTTFPSPGLPCFFEQAPRLLGLLSTAGLRRWTEYGIRNYSDHPQRQEEYFALQSADSLAVLQRERHGTLFADVERQLDLYLRALWREADQLVPYSTAFDDLRKPVPYFDKLGMRIPDVLDDANGVAGIDRYRAILAHMIGHRRWSNAQVADNWSPMQRMAIEVFEDARIEVLLMREYPGLASPFLALHPTPQETACDPEVTSCLRHRLTMLSRAFIDVQHPYRDVVLLDFVKRFHALLAHGASSTNEIAALALAYVAKTRRQSDQFARVHFDDTVIDYRDDNRHLWIFIEESDDEDFFDDPDKKSKQEAEVLRLPPRLHPEWDYRSQTYRPDWVSLYESLHPAGDPSVIDALLNKNAGLAKRLQRLLELLKPQDKVRIRYQEEGSELDLDIALRSLIDYRSGVTPDPRINMSHRTDGRDITVLLLLDLSESLRTTLAGGSQTLLQLSQEAVSLLAWAMQHLGDPYAIAGFHSNTRHDVRYHHIKGFGEGFDEAVKGRLAAMEADYSTRMGAGLRHAGHYLSHRKADKKLLLLLTDGEPADIDVSDAEQLTADARKAVEELATSGITTFCISLDPKADDYVSKIFGRQWRVVDKPEQLPEVLTTLYASLTA